MINPVRRDVARDPASFPLFANVALAAELSAEGERMPSGARGTIVDVLGGGAAYAVEFFIPQHCVLTVPAGALVPDGS